MLVFTCTELGVELASPPYGQAPFVISIKVGYLVESLSFVADFLDKLHDRIVETSIASALECNDGGILPTPSVLVATAFTGNECTAELSICTALETKFEFAIVDQGMRSVYSASFLSYIALQEHMDGGIFASEISEIDRMEYLSPLPLLSYVGDPAISVSRGSDLSLSPYTIGAVVAMSKSGFIFALQSLYRLLMPLLPTSSPVVTKI